MPLLSALVLPILLFSPFQIEAQKRPQVVITTDSGTIVIELFNECPKHRDNFLKLVNDGFYNGTGFHRVIDAFMIQGGDPNSKLEVPSDLGNGGPGYTIPAEINPAFHHKKGALCAARMGDNVNPARESSGSQFYLVQGRTFDAATIANFEGRINSDVRNQASKAFFTAPENKAYLDRLQAAMQAKDEGAMKMINDEVEPLIAQRLEGKLFKYTEQQKTDYATVGGTPHLDMQYTVFGQVVEGLEVIDKIAACKKQGERPTPLVKMTMAVKR